VQLYPERQNNEEGYCDQKEIEAETFHLAGPMVMNGESFLILNSFSGRKIMK
jgi:hypothetical protein